MGERDQGWMRARWEVVRESVDGGGQGAHRQDALSEQAAQSYSKTVWTPAFPQEVAVQRRILSGWRWCPPQHRGLQHQPYNDRRPFPDSLITGRLASRSALQANRGVPYELGTPRRVQGGVQRLLWGDMAPTRGGSITHKTLLHSGVRRGESEPPAFPTGPDYNTPNEYGRTRM